MFLTERKKWQLTVQVTGQLNAAEQVKCLNTIKLFSSEQLYLENNVYTVKTYSTSNSAKDPKHLVIFLGYAERTIYDGGRNVIHCHFLVGGLSQLICKMHLAL